MAKLGLIAGNRDFPIYVARAAKAQGLEVVAAGLREETDPRLEQEVDRMHWVTFQEIGQVPALLKADGVKQVLLAGQIRQERFLKQHESLKGAVGQLVQRLPDRSGTSAMKMAVLYLEQQGFKVLHSGMFLKDWMANKGVLGRREPTEQELKDVRYGLKMARQMSKLKIGQSVVVSKESVVAVEAMEGTDVTIQRAGSIAEKDLVLVKACGPRHDMRFDIPIVGLKTLEAARDAGVTCIGVEAKRTLLFEREQLMQQADNLNIAMVGV